MKPVALAATLAMFLGTSSFVVEPAVRSCCAQELAMLGRCTGSPDCRSCSNCSQCGFCGAGGTCGVCAPGRAGASSPGITGPIAPETAAAFAAQAQRKAEARRRAAAARARIAEERARRIKEESTIRGESEVTREIETRRAISKLHSAEALEKLGRKEGATALYREVASAIPDTPEGKTAAARAAQLAGKAAGNSKTPSAQACRVIRVVDGDTIVVLIGRTPTKVRLIGVDTPETVHPNKPVERFGREASDFLKRLLDGKWVRLEYEPGPSHLDRYGRTLAYVYLDPGDLFVNREIVAKGYGFAYVKYPFRYMEEFRKCEREARQAKLGLWGSAE